MRYTTIRIQKKHRAALEYIQIKLDKKSLQQTFAFLLALELAKHITGLNEDDPFMELLKDYSAAESKQTNQLDLFSDNTEILQDA
jgi:hypothetical protein